MSKKKKPRKKQAKTGSSATSKPSTNPLANTNETPDMESAEGSTNPSQVDQNPTSRISRYVSFGLLLGVIVIFGVVFYEVMAQFLVPLFLAALLVVVFRPLHRWIQEKCGGRQKLSALLTTASVLLVVLIPIGMLLVMAAAEGRQAYSQFSATKIAQNLKRVRTNLKLDMPSERELRLIDKELTELQGDLVLTPLEEDQHQIGLYEVQEAGKVLAQEQGLEWPEKNEEPPSLRPSAWYLFATSLTEARDLHGRIPWDTGKDPTENQQRNETIPPTLFIWGKNDILQYMFGGSSINKYIPSSRRINSTITKRYDITNCGHFPHLEKPKETAMAIEEFLISIDEST